MLRFVYGLGVVAIGALTAAGLLAPLSPQFELPNHFRPYLLVGAVVLIGIGYVSRSTAKPWAATVLASINLALAAATLPARASFADIEGEDVKVLSFNLWTSRRQDDIAAFIRGENPDLVFLQEVQPFHKTKLLAELRADYPHQAVCEDCDIAVLSKRPLKPLDVSGRTRFVSAQWTSAAGKAYTLVGVHPAWPFRPELQEEDMDDLLAASAPWRTGPLIMAGDFNLTPWSWKLNKLCWQLGLARHGTLEMSWPEIRQVRSLGLNAWPVPPLVLIDNVLTSPDIVGRDFKVGPDLGSDHRPVVATLRLP